MSIAMLAPRTSTPHPLRDLIVSPRRGPNSKTLSRRDVRVASRTKWRLASSTAVPLVVRVVAGGTTCNVMKKPDRTLPKMTAWTESKYTSSKICACMSAAGVLNRLENVFLSFSLSSCVLSCFFVLKSHLFCAKFVPAVRPNQSSLNSHGTPWSCTSNDSQLKIVIARSPSNSWGHSI